MSLIDVNFSSAYPLRGPSARCTLKRIMGTHIMEEVYPPQGMDLTKLTPIPMCQVGSV